MNKPSSKKVVKLPILPDGTNPSEGDLRRVLAMAQDKPGNSFQLPWVHVMTGALYTLCCYVTDNGVPEWTLTTGIASHSVIVWTHLTGDLELINNLVWMESSGGTTQPATANSGFSDLSDLVRSELEKSAKDRGVPQELRPSQMPSSSVTSEKSRPNVASSLQGSLKEMQVSGVLQSISMTKMTGQLVVTESDCDITIYFDEGVPLHAASMESIGDAAIMELLTWDEGQFNFIPNERTPERSINRRLEGILMEGAALVDQHQFLTKRGLKLSSFLRRKYANISEAEFEGALRDAAPIDMNVQKQMYQFVDQRRTFADILRLRPLVKSQWVPIMYNLVSCNLVEMSDKPSLAAKQSALQEIGIDQTLVNAARSAIARPETGMLTFPLFLYFLEQEFIRFEYTRWPFSLVIFDVMVNKEKGPEPIAGNAVKGLTELVDSIKREIDWLGHFRTFEFGVILPHTDVQAASFFAARLVEIARNSTVGGAVNSSDVSIAVGVAGIPQDGQTLGGLMSAAVEAKKESRERGMPVVLFHSLYKS
jgi:GGDEF domain-containing protein